MRPIRPLFGRGEISPEGRTIRRSGNEFILAPESTLFQCF